jgi:D-alanyl-D-alanine carboxypeptidase-like protein
VRTALRRVLGPTPTVSTLALEFAPDALSTAVLSGGSVSQAVGTFNYTSHPDGTITPDPRWVRAYIRQENMPIIGPVTGNKGMLPQLRAALTEVVQQGLSSSIHPSEFAGCYVPRYIGHNPAQGLSLHSWGMAVDLNVPGNQRGTVGQMDRRVVAIFKKWGFAWGGDWSYTDPMHFEMNRVVTVGLPGR